MKSALTGFLCDLFKHVCCD